MGKITDILSAVWKDNKRIYYRTLILAVILIVYMILGTFIYHIIRQIETDRKLNPFCYRFYPSDDAGSNTDAAGDGDSSDYNTTLDIAGGSGNYSTLPPPLNTTEGVTTSTTIPTRCVMPSVMAPTAAESFSFVISLLTTIGYGHIVPATSLGKVMCVFYGMIGIPLMFYFLLNLGVVLYIPVFAKFDRFLKTFSPLGTSDTKRLLVMISVLVILFFVVFVMLPALVFVSMVDLPYVTLLYVAFVTVSTTGFGDFVPEGVVNRNDGVLMWVFQLCFFGAICIIISYVMAVVVLLVNQLDVQSTLGRPTTTTAMFRYQPQTNRRGEDDHYEDEGLHYEGGGSGRSSGDTHRGDQTRDGVSFNKATLQLVDGNIQEC